MLARRASAGFAGTGRPGPGRANTGAGRRVEKYVLATDRADTVSVLKIMPGAAPEAAGHLRALDAVLARLRDRGYPAPRFRAVGHVPGLVFWVQQRMHGAVLDPGRGEPDRAALARLLPDLLRLNDAQAGLGTGTRGWPGLLTRTLTAGGDGYCLHSTLQPARPPVTCCRYCAKRASSTRAATGRKRGPNSRQVATWRRSRSR